METREDLERTLCNEQIMAFSTLITAYHNTSEKGDITFLQIKALLSMQISIIRLNAKLGIIPEEELAHCENAYRKATYAEQMRGAFNSD